MTCLNLRSLGAAMLLSTALTAPLLAEDADVVLVTATRVEADADRLPASVTVIDRDALEQSALNNLADALATVPGLQAVRSGPAGSITSLFIRGSNSKHALALYDGIRINDASSAPGVFNFGSDTLGDAQRIEVVRGPLSSIYGSDAIGGVVNIIPRAAPEDGLSPFATLELGALNTVRAGAGLGYGDERVNLVVAAERLTTAGYDVTPERMSTAGGENDGAAFLTLTARGEVAVTGAVRLDALYRWRETEVEFDTFSGGAGGSQRADDPDLESEDQLQVWALGARVTPSQALTGRLRAGRVTTALDSFNGAALTDMYESERDFAEAFMTLRPGGLADLNAVVTAGFDWREESIDTDTAFNAPLSVSEDVSSFFLIGQAAFGPLDVTASARFDDYDAFGEKTTANIGAVLPLDALSTRLRASFGSSFKAPTLSERFASSRFVTPNPTLEPEEGETLELGFDTSLALGDRADGLRIGATWYDGEIENLIENVFDFTTFTGTNRNIGAAELAGWEVFLELSPSTVIDVRFDYANTDAIDADTGDALLRRPEHAFSAAADWRVTARASLSARYSYTGERRDVTYDDDGFFLSSNGEVDAFETVDLSGRYDVSESVEVFAAIRNLFDEEYEPAAAFAGAPRTMSIGLRWRP